MHPRKLTTIATLAVTLGVGLSAARAQKIYWADPVTDKMQRADLDGSNVEDLVTTGLMDPWDVALDLSAGKIYWTDWGADRIQRANLDGSNVEDIVTGLDGPSGIALDLPAPRPTLSPWGIVGMATVLLILGSILIPRCRERLLHTADSRSAQRGRCAVRNTGLRVTSALCVLSGLGSIVVAQPGTIPSEVAIVNVESGSVSAPGSGSNPVAVFSHAVSVEGAPWPAMIYSAGRMRNALALS